MRHLNSKNKLGRTSSHRNALLANLACSLIENKRITTTLAKAKALRPVVEKLVTLGKRGQAAIKESLVENVSAQLKSGSIAENVHCRRLASAKLRRQSRTFFKGTKTNPGKISRLAWKAEHDVVHILFDSIAPMFFARNGGYTRIVKIGSRRGDVAEMAIIEWVENTTPVDVAVGG